MNDKKLVVIVGPTAVGKTKLAISLARRLHTEIVSADSRQVYKELNIGTAKPTDEELSAVPHHFINHKSIEEDYDAALYGNEALSLIGRLFQKYDTLILCGGSGLYVRAVLEGFDDIPAIPQNVRQAVNAEFEEKGLSWLQHKVEDLDPEYFKKADTNNPRRLIRALEVRMATGKPLSAWWKKEKRKHPYAIVKVGIEADRTDLHNRIDKRMDDMIAAGLFEEAKSFYPKRNLQALQTVGYKEIFEFMDGKYDREEAVRLLKRNSRHYAKRQLTWFRKEEDITWFDATAEDAIFDFIMKEGKRE